MKPLDWQFFVRDLMFDDIQSHDLVGILWDLEEIVESLHRLLYEVAIYTQPTHVKSQSPLMRKWEKEARKAAPVYGLPPGVSFADAQKRKTLHSKATR
jgi:hypothetical protein